MQVWVDDCWYLQILLWGEGSDVVNHPRPQLVVPGIGHLLVEEAWQSKQLALGSLVDDVEVVDPGTHTLSAGRLQSDLTSWPPPSWSSTWVGPCLASCGSWASTPSPSPHRQHCLQDHAWKYKKYLSSQASLNTRIHFLTFCGFQKSVKEFLWVENSQTYAQTCFWMEKRAHFSASR